MNQNDVESINLEEIKLSDKNKKMKSFRQIIFLSIGSLVATLLMIDISSGIIGGLGIISFSSLLLIPILFAFPITIKTPKLLLIPIILLPLSIFIITFGFFSPYDRLWLTMIFCLVSTIAATLGVAAGALIRLALSKRIFLKIIATTIGIITMVAVLIVVSNYISNPLRKSNEEIRESILEITPISTSMEDVIKVIETKEEWETRYIDYELGVSYGDLGYRRKSEDIALNRQTIIGEKSILAKIGEYSGEYLFRTHVEVYWAFDENLKLIDIFIRKTSDSF